MPYPNPLKKSLESHKVDSAVVNRVFDGFLDIEDKSPKKAKVAFMRQAMRVLDEALSPEERYAVVSDCACCLGGTREKKVKEFRKAIMDQPLTLAEKVERLCQAKPFHNSTSLDADGTIVDGIYYQANGKYRCVCGCISGEKLDEPISKTYCLCCAGHFRHHLQKALGVDLRLKEVASSPLDSFGKSPCVFRFEVMAQ